MNFIKIYLNHTQLDLVGSSCVFKFNFKYTWRSWGKICDLTKQTARPHPPPSNKPSWKIRANQEDKTLILLRSEWWQEIQCGGDLTCIFTRRDLRGGGPSCMRCDNVVTCPERAKSFLPLSPLSWGGPPVQGASTVGLGQMIKAQGTWCEIEFYADRTSFNIFGWGGTFARARMALPVSRAWPPFRKKKMQAVAQPEQPGSHIQILQHCGVDALAGQNSPTFNIGRR